MHMSYIMYMDVYIVYSIQNFKYYYYTMEKRRNIFVIIQGDALRCLFILAYAVIKC